MMEEPEFQKGTGPDAMSQGEAGDLNAAVAAIPQSADPRERIEGVEWADGTEGGFEPDPNDEDAQILYGPPEGLTSRTGIAPTDNQPVPPHLLRQLPLLRAAAADPMAPASLKAAVRLLERRIAMGG